MASVLPEIESLCTAAQDYGASDILLHESQPPRLRLEGQLVELDLPPLGAEVFQRFWEACGAEAGAADHDGSYTSAGGVRFRVNLLRQLGLHAVVMRRIRSVVPEMDSLGLPVDLLQNWCSRNSGIVLVCGPTGSGKSTTLASALQWINHNHPRHVVTIEDPVEYLFRNERSIFTQREVGIDTPSFAEGLRRALRQNPDIIFVGEIRDAQTATTAIQAAETGHLVLSTLHSSNCSEAVERLQLLFPPEGRDNVRKTLSHQLIGILCQRLFPGAKGGVALVAEYVSNIASVRKFVRDGTLSDLADFIARSDDHEARDFVSSTTRLVRSGAITEDVATAYCDHSQALQRALRGIASSARASRGAGG